MKLDKKKSFKIKEFFLPKGVRWDKKVIKNLSTNGKKIILKHKLLIESPYVLVCFNGKLLNEKAGVEIRFITADRKWVSESVAINSKVLVSLRDEPKTKNYLLYIKIPAGAEFAVDKIEVVERNSYSIINFDNFKSDVLIITPMFPSLNKPYSATFVYSKVKEYIKNGINPDVAVVSNADKNLYQYNYDGIKVNKMSFDDLRNVIQKGKYKKILIHFFDRQICNSLLACDLDDKEIFIYCHGADVDLWNPDIHSGYFLGDRLFSQKENELKEDRLDALKIFAKKPNVKWIFNTKWNLDNARKATGIKFENHEIIPCIISEEDFKYVKRTKSQKNNILILKKMDDVRQYAVDLAARIIMRLSKESFFENLNITVAGSGDYQKELAHPLEKFENVKIIDRFFDHDKINEVFLENGILLAPSRYDTQGVTVGEAAMSGMVVVASKGTGVSDMLPEKLGTFFDNNKLEEAVKIISDIVNEKKNIEKLSEDFHNAISKTASKEKIKEEISLIKAPVKAQNRLKNNNKSKKELKRPVLTIAIPAYNAAQYLENTIKSLVDHKHVDWLEIIVVNDGSKDDTTGLIKKIIKNASPLVKSSIVYIDKENGGHGSTINAALKIAKGKYFRVVDADDRLDSSALEKHLEFLVKTDVDIVFTNTMHDLSVEAIFKPDHKYDFMEPHTTYNFDELCEQYYGFRGYGPVLSTTSTNTDRLREVGCNLTEKSFYVDIEYNYYMTEASNTAALDPVDLYYYYLGRDGQSLSNESYKRNFLQHLNVLESVINLLEQNKLSKLKYEHFVRIQLHETIFHQYRIALEMFNDYKKFLKVEKTLKKYPKYYNDDYLTPGYVRRMRKFGFPYYLVRKIAKKIRPMLGSIKRMTRSK